jgi:hypothetical protein
MAGSPKTVYSAAQLCKYNHNNLKKVTPTGYLCDVRGGADGMGLGVRGGT